ncbi:reverse transcriptase [Caerostris darwini]|uniref:Reverse transcriptase n=1 Tax=Caerostris darwini TaxID=1538125 RepID=A0AAV4V0R9_9ARAC|nr:reverse transcriptase [Caerostris darwini]
MSEANSITEALDLQAQLIQMLSSTRLILRKWASNCNEPTNLIQEDLRLPNVSLSIDDDRVKTLGILWHPATDVFFFNVNSLSLEGTLTKRILLSEIAKTFDPLGWLSPITIQCKLLEQKLWKYQLQWMKSFLQTLQLNGRHYQRTYYLLKTSEFQDTCCLIQATNFNYMGLIMPQKKHMQL